MVLIKSLVLTYMTLIHPDTMHIILDVTIYYIVIEITFWYQGFRVHNYLEKNSVKTIRPLVGSIPVNSTCNSNTNNHNSFIISIGFCIRIA